MTEQHHICDRRFCSQRASGLWSVTSVHDEDRISVMRLCASCGFDAATRSKTELLQSYNTAYVAPSPAPIKPGTFVVWVERIENGRLVSRPERKVIS